MYSIRNRHLTAATGLSLIELMVALVIGSVIMLGAATLFLQNKRSFVQDEEMARLQESGRYAIRYVTRELSMAGYYGNLLRGSEIDHTVVDPNDPECYPYMFQVQSKFVHVDAVDEAADFDASGMPVIGTDPCLDVDEIQENSDVIVVRRVKDNPTVDQGTLTPGASIEPDVVYVEIEDYNVSIALKNGLGGAAADVDLWEYYPQILYVRQYATTAGDDIPTLCRIRISRSGEAMADTECLVQGIEDMQVEFGIDNTGDFTIDAYTATPTADDMANALSARVYLLVRSQNEVVGYTNDKSFTLGSRSIAAADINDGYYRRVFQSTVSLRNSEALGI